MWVKTTFSIYLSVCFIGSILCDKFIPFTTAPRKRYYFSEPTNKVDLVDAISWCSSMQMTLATVDNIQDQKMLLRQLRKDYSRHTTFGPSEFWLVDPNGLNKLQRVLALPYSNARKCVKLVFTPLNVKWIDGACQGRHRFICTGQTYSLQRVGKPEGQLMAQLFPMSLLKPKVLHTVLAKDKEVLEKLFKEKLRATKAYTETEVTKLLKIARDDLLTHPKPDEMHICKETPLTGRSNQVLLAAFCNKAIDFSKAEVLSVYDARAYPIDPLRRDMETMIPKIREDLNWSREKAEKVIDVIVDVLKYRLNEAMLIFGFTV